MMSGNLKTKLELIFIIEALSMMNQALESEFLIKI